MTFARIPFNSNDPGSNLTSTLNFGFDTSTNTMVVGTTPLTGSAAAAIRVISTTQGVGFPPMTTTQKNAIGSPFTGLMVYDTTLNDISFYNGSAWVEPSTGSGYQSFTVSTSWSGIWAAPQVANIYGQVFGDSVTLTLVGVTATANAASAIVNTGTLLDVDLRPLRDLIFPINCIDGANPVEGSIEIFTTGAIVIRPCSTGMTRLNLGANYTSGLTAGFFSTGLSYLKL